MENAIRYLLKALPVKGGQTLKRGLGTWWSIPGCLMPCGARCRTLLFWWHLLLYGSFLLLPLEGKGCDVNAADY